MFVDEKVSDRNYRIICSSTQHEQEMEMVIMAGNLKPIVKQFKEVGKIG